MYEKFSSRVEKVIKLARQLARNEDQDYLGTEHILLAILDEGTGAGAKLLMQNGVDEHRLKAQITKLVHKSMDETWVFGQLPGSPHLKNAVAAAIEQAQALNSNEVCAEHLLLGLLKETGCVAAVVLRHFGVTYESARAELIRITCGE